MSVNNLLSDEPENRHWNIKYTVYLFHKVHSREMPRRTVKVPLSTPIEESPVQQEEVENSLANLSLEESHSGAAKSAAAGSAAAGSAAAGSTSVATNNPEDHNYVYLTCVKADSKLRVRITSPGYLTTANCQFPRDLRVQGRHFRVKPHVVKLMTVRNKYYYCIKSVKDIEIIDASAIPKQPPPKIKIYQDTEQEECLICYDAVKEAVFNPCGHFYTCHACSTRCKTCPVCRHPVISVIDKADLD